MPYHIDDRVIRSTFALGQKSFVTKNLLTTLLLVCVTSTAHGATPSVDDAALRAARIDERLQARQEQLGITPAPLVDDARYLRRVTLDLIGRVPTVAETRDYLADPSPDKSRRLVGRLLASPLFARHWATIWRRAWIPQADTPQFTSLADDADYWLAERIREHAPHDRIVRQLLQVSSTQEPKTPSGRATPRVFLVAGEFKPESLAANSARAFLGVNLECAQCHDHPFARWTRDEFWQTAAFFAAPTQDGGEPTTLKIKIPETERTVAARYLVDRPVPWPKQITVDTGRQVLADWITARDNPFFARHAVNTAWAQLFGAGLVEPLDDLARDDPMGDPEFLQQLAEETLAADFDLTRFIESCVLTDAYRRTTSGLTNRSGRTTTLEEERFAFAQMPIRALSGEQLFDSLRTAAGFAPPRDDLARHESGSARRAFAGKFRIDRAESAQRSVLQSLSLMNGEVTSAAVDARNGPLVVAVAEGPFDSLEQRAETLFLAALNRLPEASELAIVTKHLQADGPEGLHRRTADIFWALLNTAEFSTNQ